MKRGWSALARNRGPHRPGCCTPDHARVVAKAVPNRLLASEISGKRMFTGIVLMFSLASPGGIPLTTYISTGIPRESNGFTAVAELDPVKRLAMSHQIQAMVMDDLPLIPLDNGADIFIAPKWLTGLTPPRAMFYPSLWIEYWKPR